MQVKLRRAFAIPCCLAFANAFILAPFQHVHHDESHNHPALIHAHFHDHAHHDHVDKPGEREIESIDEEQASSLDTFTLVLTAHFAPFIPSRAPAIVEPPAETRESFQRLEQRGHDPPPSRNSSPRAPPV